MEFEKSIKIKRAVAERLQTLLDQEEIDFEKKDVEEDSLLLCETVKFDNGYTMDFKVCSGQTNCWSEAVLFNESGIEVGVTEPSYELLGECYFLYKQDEYIVNVEAE